MNRAQASLKRFWKTAGVSPFPDIEGAFAITLDGRPLKTPDGAKLVLPKEKRLVAALVAAEWENQEKLLKAHALPMTSIASRAIDAMHSADKRAEVREALLKYLDTDTICFLEVDPPHLVELQKTHWTPILDWIRETYDVEVVVHDSVLPSPQSPDTVRKLDEVMQTFDPWEMAALERATYTTKSLLIALALVKRRITAEQAAAASHVEVNSQIERWGEVEDSHDVDYHDVRRQLGSAAVLLSNA